MLEKSRKSKPTFTRLCTEIREKRFTLIFSKASPTQTDKGQAKPFYFRAIFENSNSELQRSRKEKKRALKLILKTQTTRS